MKKKSKTKELTTTLNPQQLAFLGYYSNPNSESFGNLYQSAIKAGYEHSYATSIGFKGKEWIGKWMGEFGRDLQRLHKAEKVFDEALDLPIEEDAIGAFGVIIDKKTGKPYRKINTQILKEKVNVSKFMGETIGRNKYAKKIEVVGSFNKDEFKKEYE